jgi:3-methylfumaryl-CoA hydratase
MPQPAHSEDWLPDSTQLFRYSALTFNGHRIHYDADYAREVEGYAGLVVHGPLSATMLAALAQRQLGRPLARFAYRGQRAAIAGQPLRLHACRDGEGLVLWTTLADGAVSMRAEAA